MDEFDLALEDCLRQLDSGRSSLGQCLARYPKYAAQLRPLLETSLRLQRGKDLRPSGSTRDRMRGKVASHIEKHPRPRIAKEGPRLAFVMPAVAIAVLAISAGLAQAALPGQSLYPLKLSTENAWRSAAPDPSAVDIVLASRREDEILRMVREPARTGLDDQQLKAAETQAVSAYCDLLRRLSTETKGPELDTILSGLQQDQANFAGAGIHIQQLDALLAESHGQGPNHKP